MLRLTLIAGLLFTAVSGCSSRPESAGSNHPPAADLTCLGEPPALTDAEIEALANDPAAAAAADQQFSIDNIMAERSCRDALRRSCEWHRVRDPSLDCSNPPFVRAPDPSHG